MSDHPKTPRRIADDYVERVAAADPATSVGLGLHLDDDRQPDLSPEGLEAAADLARAALAALDAAPTTEDPAELACARLLRERLTAGLAVQEAGDEFCQLRNTGAPFHQLRGIFTMMPTATEENWAAVASRLRNLPGALDGYRATLSEGFARGLSPAAEGTPDAVGRERYLRAARYWTGADLDVDEAYAWAWSEFHRMLAQMRVEAGRCCPARPCWRRWGT